MPAEDKGARYCLKFTKSLTTVLFNYNEKLRSDFYLPDAKPGRAGKTMLQGLYKVEFETPRRKAVGIIFASDGQLHGGSSAFAYIGSYDQKGNTITGTVKSVPHTDDPNHPSVFGVSRVRIDFHGVEKGDYASIEGTAAEFPSLGFRALLTQIRD